MTYNLYIKHETGAFNIIDLLPEKIDIIVRAYRRGDYEFTISGTKYNWGNLQDLQIYEHVKNMTIDGVEKFCQDNAGWETGYGYYRSPIISKKTLELLGNNVTEDFLHDLKFGQDAAVAIAVSEPYIHLERIEQLTTLTNKHFDFKKLIILCEELNESWDSNSVFTTGLLLRSIINHVPPIFNSEFKSFGQVVANYPGSRSFKEAMEHLEKSLRKIADSYTHEIIRTREVLPMRNQVDFRQSLDMLLSEVIRIAD